MIDRRHPPRRSILLRRITRDEIAVAVLCAVAFVVLVVVVLNGR